MTFGKIFSKDGEVTGELEVLRYSAFDTWLKSPASYRDKYYLGKNFTTPETVFGHQMHKVMEKKSTWKKHPVLKNVPRFEVSEKDIVVDLDGVRIGGRIDSFDPEMKEFIDYKFSHRNKDGKEPWDAPKVARHRQMVFYAILIAEKLGKVGRYQRLVWVETAFGKKQTEFDGHALEAESRELYLTGNFKVFKRMVTKWEREKMKLDIVRVAKEIEIDYARYKQV